VGNGVFRAASAAQASPAAARRQEPRFARTRAQLRDAVAELDDGRLDTSYQ